MQKKHEKTSFCPVPAEENDGCKCLSNDLLHGASHWQTLIQWSVGNYSKHQSSMVLSNSHSVEGILCIAESYCQTLNDQHFLSGVTWGKKTRSKEIRNLPESATTKDAQSLRSQSEKEEGRSQRSKQKEVVHFTSSTRTRRGGSCLKDIL